MEFVSIDISDIQNFQDMDQMLCMPGRPYGTVLFYHTAGFPGKRYCRNVENLRQDIFFSEPVPSAQDVIARLRCRVRQ